MTGMDQGSDRILALFIFVVSHRLGTHQNSTRTVRSLFSVLAARALESPLIRLRYHFAVCSGGVPKFSCETLWEQKWMAIQKRLETYRAPQRTISYCVRRSVRAGAGPHQSSQEGETTHEGTNEQREGKSDAQARMRKYLPKWGNIIQIGHYALIIRFVFTFIIISLLVSPSFFAARPLCLVLLAGWSPLHHRHPPCSSSSTTDLNGRQ